MFTPLAALSFSVMSLLSPHVTAQEMAQWHRVAVCETGEDWAASGPIYSGGLGILNTNWTTYRLSWMPSNAGSATPVEQVWVAMRINRGNPVPDQDGCRAW